MAARILNIAIGIFLLAAPGFLGYEGPARVNHLIVGPIAASIAVMAMSQVLRELRWLNSLLGAWLVFSPVLIGHDRPALVVGITCGIAIALLALVRGPTDHRLGGGWRAVLHPNSASDAEEAHR